MEFTNGLVDAARKHLEIIRSDHEKQDAQDVRHVTHAYMYGVETDEIAETTGLSVDRVQTILRGA
jgi:hypothetical protein